MKKYLLLAIIVFSYGTALSQVQIQTNEPTAEELYEKAFDYLRGESGEDIDTLKARQLFLKSAEMGYAPAQCESAFFEEKDLVSLGWLLKATEQNYPLAFWHVSKMYHQGTDNVPQDMVKAKTYLERGAELGDATCQWILGGNYHFGEDGYPVNAQKALLWLEKAASQNHLTAMQELGDIYREGTIVKRNMSKAIEWYTKASDLGDPICKTALANAYEDGDGVEINREYAFNLVREAASLGYDRAQLRLSMMLCMGRGCQKDIESAKYWLGLAVKSTNDEIREAALEWLNALEK